MRRLTFDQNVSLLPLLYALSSCFSFMIVLPLPAEPTTRKIRCKYRQGWYCHCSLWRQLGARAYATRREKAFPHEDRKNARKKKTGEASAGNYPISGEPLNKDEKPCNIQRTEVTVSRAQQFNSYQQRNQDHLIQKDLLELKRMFIMTPGINFMKILKIKVKGSRCQDQDAQMTEA